MSYGIYMLHDQSPSLFLSPKIGKKKIQKFRIEFELCIFLENFIHRYFSKKKLNFSKLTKSFFNLFFSVSMHLKSPLPPPHHCASAVNRVSSFLLFARKIEENLLLHEMIIQNFYFHRFLDYY